MSYTDLQNKNIMKVKEEASESENNPVGLPINVHIKLEPLGDGEEHITEKLDLYAGHEIKEELVVGPVVLQPVNLVQESCVQNTSNGLNIDTRPHKCDICAKCYTNKHHLRRHKTTHSGPKPNQCEQCNGSITCKASCNKHLRTQPEEKQHKCDICHKCFTQKHVLKAHIFTHTGEKPYKCDICNKHFTRKFYAKRHMVVHTGEKPYKCDICHKFFSSKDCCKAHLKTHTGEKPYKCDHCNKSFIRKVDCKTHSKTHTGEKPYKSCVVPIVKHGGGSIMVWGCMTDSGAGEMFVCESHMNFKEFMRPYAIPE
ncbi:zinc finger protein 436-like [Hyposmocoma kahamanoa]|uniref:zinc finger protein 436-like n=1 Tax=Hyposmocoma kahamanoa TaxID=1477025 RepID=UPI000E6D7FF0|nr:zinc finger protein 436-like [Hyposmocoma kahamanoa]